MDPFTISTLVVKITAICLSTAKSLSDIRNKYSDSPLSIVTICSETTVIAACLSHLQTIVCRKQDFVQVLDSRPELAHALDTALTGCMVLFSCVDEEIRKITADSSQASALSWKGKVKAVWNHERLRDLLDSLRGQQVAINLLIQLVQLDSLGEIKQVLNQNRPVLAESIRRTQSLKKSHPDILFPASIYSVDDRQSIYSNVPSITGASELEFDFDDVVVNSKVYRRVLASARGKVLEANRPIIEGDLIDLSDSQTVTEAKIDEVTQDLECLIVSQHEQPLNVFPEPSISQTANDLGQPRMFAGQESPERENARVLYTTNVSQKHRDDSVNVPGYAGISKRLQENSENPKKEVQFGDYVLGQTLHVGKQSKVKLCRKVEGGVLVVIKLIKRPPPKNLMRLTEIYREVGILREFHHPNIVRLLEMVETEKHIGVVLEYASGGELLDYISNHRYLRDNAARRIFAQLVSGVGYLHKIGVVHRDLRLDNIFLDRNRNIIISGFTSAQTFNPEDELGDEIEYNLSDREFVKRLELDKVGPCGSRCGDLMQTSCGSRIYAAPELVISSLYTGRKADIWSCGVILYAMLAGYCPFDDDPTNPDGENVNLLYKYIVSTLLTFPDYVTPHARDLLRRVLVPDPRKRADLLEVARHSWLSEYSHVVAFVSGGADPEPKGGVKASADVASPRGTV